MRRGFKLSGETMVDWFSRSFEKHEDMGPSHTMGANVTHYVELFSGAKLLHINKPMKMGDQEEIGVEKK